MCGIAGVIVSRESTQSLETVTGALERMQKALHHRGPDDQGYWRSPCGSAHLAHTRLSIIDLSPGGHQPMTSPDGRFTITFNGEIYNYRQLRKRLSDEGIHFSSTSDTEVILRLFEKFGAECVKQLRGMFAFAIWDNTTKSCFLARDGYGIKPLYYSCTQGKLVFASELKALQASGLCLGKINPNALVQFFRTGSVPEPLTMISGVHMLSAGHCMSWTADQGSSITAFWHIDFPTDVDVASHVALLRSGLSESINAHFVSDVPVGLFLSGGIDSTAILALAKKGGHENLRTFSIGVNDPERDECVVARRTATHFGTDHTELRLDANSGRVLFQKFLAALDQPTIDGFNTFTVSSLAHQSGMKVVLSGLGGDELFAGYPSFKKLPQLMRLSAMLGPLRRPAGALLSQLYPSGPKKRLSEFLRQAPTLRGAYYTLRGVFPGSASIALASHLTGSEVESASPNESDEPMGKDAKLDNEISRMESCLYMRNQLLRDSDVMSMAHGLELRVPFVDTELFGLVSCMSVNQRLRQGKVALLEAVPEVPSWVSQAPKRGFLFPYEQWLGTPEWKADFDRVTKDLPVRPDSWYQKWSLFVFDHWRRTHGL